MLCTAETLVSTEEQSCGWASEDGSFDESEDEDGSEDEDARTGKSEHEVKDHSEAEERVE